MKTTSSGTVSRHHLVEISTRGWTHEHLIPEFPAYLFAVLCSPLWLMLIYSGSKTSLLLFCCLLCTVNIGLWYFLLLFVVKCFVKKNVFSMYDFRDHGVNFGMSNTCPITLRSLLNMLILSCVSAVIRVHDSADSLARL